MLRDRQAAGGDIGGRRERLEPPVERGGDAQRVGLGQLGALAGEQLVDRREPQAQPLLELLRQLSTPLVPLMEGCDLLLLCADKPAGEIQRWVNSAALRTRTPWILSAYAGPTLVVGTFVPGETPCYGCYEHHVGRAGNTGEVLFEQGELNAVIAPAAGLAGHYAALEAINHLTGLRPQTVGRKPQAPHRRPQGVALKPQADATLRPIPIPQADATARAE